MANVECGDLAEGRCNPQCIRPAGEVQQVLLSSLCSYTWQKYTGSPRENIDTHLLIYLNLNFSLF